MNRIKEIRKRKEYSQKDVATAIGVTQSQYSRYESGATNIPGDMLPKIADFLKSSVDEILGINTPAPEPFGRPIVMKPELEPEDEVMIPLVASLRCGYDAAGEPFSVIRKIPIPKSYVAKWGTNLVALEAVGRSMIPTIRPGDLMICIPGEAWENNHIVDIDVNDSDTIKRIFRSRHDGGIDLVPDNEEFEPQHFSPEDLELYQAHVLGRVVKTIGPDL